MQNLSVDSGCSCSERIALDFGADAAVEQVSFIVCACVAMAEKGLGCPLHEALGINNLNLPDSLWEDMGFKEFPIFRCIPDFLSRCGSGVFMRPASCSSRSRSAAIRSFFARRSETILSSG